MGEAGRPHPFIAFRSRSADAQGMVGGLLGTAAAAVAAAAAAIASHPLGSSPVTGRTSAFGSSVPVHLVHVGHIEVDLEDSGATGLHREPCAFDTGALICFVAR